ncbi:MAG: hypothetical protein M0D57_10470 [Sphingobacteriales bacterium JAD_PAG50586_3]|nr:MAG: hypothetical protein M0D57_10470 [Sphingobacteriales bacterium JAD_PAG50586_3]
MNKLKSLFACIAILLCVASTSAQTTKTWAGGTSTAWNTASNWSPSGVPASGDHVIFNGTGTYQPTLDQDRTVGNITVTGNTVSLATYSLTVNGTTTLTAGTVNNGTIKFTNATTTFGGTTFGSLVVITASNIYFNGSTFNGVVRVNKTGISANNSTGGNTFNDSLVINNAGGTLAMYSSTSNDAYNGNIAVSQTGCGACGSPSTISFGTVASSATASLASGKTVTINPKGGFTVGTLLFARFTQLGSTAQSLTLTGTATLQIGSAPATRFQSPAPTTWNGNVTTSAPNVIVEHSTFNGTSAFTKSSTTSNAWYGDNTFVGAMTLNVTGTGNVTLSNTLGDTYNSTANYNLSSTGLVYPANTDTSFYKGNIAFATNNNNVTFSNGAGITQFSGSTAQAISKTGTGIITIKSTIINKTSNDLTLSTPVKISSSLKLSSGKIITTSTNILTLTSTASSGAGSNTSYVQGPMAKEGNSAFTFPVGKSGTLRSLGISAPSSSASVFTAEYFFTGQSFGSSKDTSLHNISNCEYWTLTRSGSSSNVNTTLSWNRTTCNIYEKNTTKVATWTGSMWSNQGGTSRTGDFKSGTVTSSSASSNYTAYILDIGDDPDDPSFNSCSSQACNLIYNGGYEAGAPNNSQNDVYFGSYVDCWVKNKAADVSITAYPQGLLFITSKNTPDIHDATATTGTGCVDGSTTDPYYFSVPTNFTGSKAHNSGTWAPGGGGRYVSLYHQESVVGKFSSVQSNRVMYLELYASKSTCSGLSDFNFRIGVGASNYSGTNSAGTHSSKTPLALFNYPSGSGSGWTKFNSCFDPNVIDFPSLSNIIIYGVNPDGGNDVNKRIYLDDARLCYLADAGDDDEVCTDATIGPECPISGATYLWSCVSCNGATFSDVNVANPVVTLYNYTSSPIYSTFKVTVTSPASSPTLNLGGDFETYGDASCTDEDEVTIIFNPTPLPPEVTGSEWACGINTYTVTNPHNNSIYVVSVKDYVNPTAPVDVSGILVNITPFTYTTLAGNNSFNVDWTGVTLSPTGVYKIIVTEINTYDCPNSTIIDLKNCCIGSGVYANVDISNTKASQLATLALAHPSSGLSSILNTTVPNVVTLNNSYTGVIVPPNSSTPTISINGDFIVDVATVNFTNCNVILGPNANIILQGSSNLTLNITDSWLHACSDKLWNGIFEGDATYNQVINVNHSLIEDARNAIVSSLGDKVKTYGGSIFNKNVKHIVFTNSAITAPGPGEIYNTTFKCSAMPLAGVPPISPTPQRTERAIDINAVFTVTVGDIGQTYNTFTDANYGIYSVNSNTFVWNSRFTNFNQLFTNNRTAIFAKGSKSYVSSITVWGTTSSSTTNLFTNCRYGVRTENFVNVDVRNNIFKDGTPIVPRSIGVQVSNSAKNNINVSNNTFENIDFSILSYDNRGSIVKLNSNIVTNNLIDSARAISAIDVSPLWAQNGSSLCCNNVKIQYNTISDTRHGILSQQLAHTNIFYNHIGIQSSLTNTQANRTHNGIWLRGTIENLVRNNRVYSDANNNRRIIGIKDDNSFFGAIQCNWINRDFNDDDLGTVGIAISMGNSFIFRIAGNHMQNAPRGILITNQSLLGDQSGSKRAADNHWHLTSGGNDFNIGYIRTEAGTNGTWSRYWPHPNNISGTDILFPPTCVGCTGYTEDFNIQTVPVPFTALDNNDPGFSCTTYGWTDPAPALAGYDFKNLRKMSRNVAKDSIAYGMLPTETSYLNKLRLYTAIKFYHDSLAADTYLAGFETTNNTTNIGRLYKYSNVIAGSYFTSALSLPDTVFAARNLTEYNTSQFSVDTTLLKQTADSLLAFTPTNKPEVCAKAVFSVAISSLIKETRLSPNSTFSLNLVQTEIDSLSKYAVLCPLEYGTGVYSARAMLMHQNDSLAAKYVGYVTHCDTIGGGLYARLTDIDNETESPLIVKVFPNPAQDVLNVAFSKEIEEDAIIRLYDVTGKNVASYPLRSTTTEISIGNMSNGLYIYDISRQGKVIEHGKIVIYK